MKLLLFLWLLLISAIATAQCNIQINERDDGVAVKYTRPGRIGFSDRVMIALSMQSNGQEYFVAVLSIFEKAGIKLTGELTLKFQNNKSTTVEHYRSEMTTFNGLPACVSLFTTDSDDLIRICSSSCNWKMEPFKRFHAK
jgi:hypothetical protein